MPYFWLAVLVAAVALEAATADFVAIWFFPAALVSMVMAFCGADPIWQWVVFVVIGLLLVASTRRLCKRWLRPSKDSVTNVDLLVGCSCRVSEDINNLAETGAVRLRGTEWSAIAERDDVTIPVGTVVTVLEVRGVKLLVR